MICHFEDSIEAFYLFQILVCAAELTLLKKSDTELACFFQVDTVNELWKKIFENYKSWCRYLHVSYNIMYVV
jgi:hypothetical protein